MDSSKVQDRLLVFGSVGLDGRLIVVDGFGSPVGTRFTIIDNRGTNPISGTFDGIGEGAVIPVTQIFRDPVSGGFSTATQLLQITYRGGDGNDVVLTHINTPASAEDLRLTTHILGRGALARLTGHLTDPDLIDKLTLTIDWGDQSRVETFHPGRKPFAIPHHYREEGTYIVRVRWFDEHGGGNSRDLTVTVRSRREHSVTGEDVLGPDQALDALFALLSKEEENTKHPR